jgi:hypothetical protein
MAKRQREDDEALGNLVLAPEAAAAPYIRRTLNAFGGAASLVEGTQFEVPPGTLHTALSEYGVANGKASSVVAGKKYDDIEDEEDQSLFMASSSDPSIELELGFGELE